MQGLNICPYEEYSTGARVFAAQPLISAAPAFIESEFPIDNFPDRSFDPAKPDYYG